MKNIKQRKICDITAHNLIPICVYFSIRRCITDWWLIHRDQLLFPNEGWQDDELFQTDCLIYTLFHENNRVQCKHGKNNWIPFTDEEMNAELELMAKQYNTDVDQIKAMIGEANLVYFKKDIQVKKAIDFVYDNCKATKKKASKKAEAKEEAEEK